MEKQNANLPVVYCDTDTGTVQDARQIELPFNIAGDLAECLDRISKLSDDEKRDFLRLFMNSRFEKRCFDFIPRRVHK